MTNAARPDAAETRARVAELHEQGLSRNAIAREIGCSPSTVSKHAKTLGLSFDRTATKAATEAKVQDLAQRRANLVEGMMTAAEDALEFIKKRSVKMTQITQRGTVVSTERDVDLTDVRQAMVIGGIAVDKATKLIDRDAGVEGAESTLDAIQKVVTVAALGLIDGEQTAD